MKAIFYLLVCLFGVSGATSAQNLLRPDVLPQWKLHLMPSPGLKPDLIPAPGTSGMSITVPAVEIRSLRPDNMPCLVPDLSRLEKMPIRRSTNSDPMPKRYRDSRPVPRPDIRQP